jgi:hypothetical protein
VNCIAVGIKNTEQVRGDINIGSEYIGSRDGNIFGEGAISVYPHPQGIRAKVQTAGQAVPAAATNHVALTRDDVTKL